MCGLAGAAGALDVIGSGGDNAVVNGLLFVSSFRGMDSTGVAGRALIDEVGAIDVYKAAVASPEFIDFPKCRTIVNRSNNLILGHTRSRTVGEVNKKNAQPFDFDNVTGTHNGTLDWGTKHKLEGPGKVCSTDSEALYFHIDAHGLEAALKLFEPKDAAALVWYDKNEHSINFYRNAHRPLHYCYSPDRNKVYWASEAGMLYLVLNRFKMPFEKVRLLPENLHWKQKLPTERGKAFPKPVTRFCKSPVPEPVVVQRSAVQSAQTFIVRDHRACGTERSTDYGQPDLLARANAHGSGVGDNTGRANVHDNPPDLGKYGTAVDLSKFRMNRMIVRSATQGGNYYKSDFTAQTFDRDRFDAKMDEGCGVCGTVPAWGEPVKFLRDNGVICASCMEEAKHHAAKGDVDNATLLLVSQMT